jgi:uncharacterized membrane protein YhaH (DUF805 family)
MENIDFTYLLFKFDGRINRAKFWLGMVILWAANAVLGTIILSGRDSSILFALAIVASFVLIWPSLAVSIKRWHDRDKSGWWVLIVLVPFIGWIWALVETGFLAGTPDRNQYGPDPLAAVPGV